MYPSKTCGRQPLKNFIWFIREFFTWSRLASCRRSITELFPKIVHYYVRHLPLSATFSLDVSWKVTTKGSQPNVTSLRFYHASASG